MGRQISTGDEFGRLRAVKLVGRNKWRDQLWECACECGEVVTVAAGKLKSGHTRSCGCLAVDTRTALLEKHGITTGGKPRTFTIWNGMKARCLNPRSTSYRNYGGRGIGICPEWMEFKAFHEWAMANGYSDELQLDRIDNDGDYRPDNCRWVTREENLKNTRRTSFMTICGETRCAVDWIKVLGISRSTYYWHIKNDPDKGQRYFIERYCTHWQAPIASTRTN